MASSTAQQIIEDRKQKLIQLAPQESSENQLSFYAINHSGGGEIFISFHLATGRKIAFAYNDLTKIDYDPNYQPPEEDSVLDLIQLHFREEIVSIFGRNLGSNLYNRILDCKVKWLRAPALSETDHDGYNIFIYGIDLSSGSEEQAPESQE